MCLAFKKKPSQASPPPGSFTWPCKPALASTVERTAPCLSQFLISATLWQRSAPHLQFPTLSFAFFITLSLLRRDQSPPSFRQFASLVWIQKCLLAPHSSPEESILHLYRLPPDIKRPPYRYIYHISGVITSAIPTQFQPPPPKDHRGRRFDVTPSPFRRPPNSRRDMPCCTGTPLPYCKKTPTPLGHP